MALEQSIELTLSKAVRAQAVTKVELERFWTHLRGFLSELEASPDEEFSKTLVRQFLSVAFYGEHHAINSNNPTDLVIYADASAKGSHPVVLFEIKHHTNDEMLRRDDLNRKALHELILYYMREELLMHNTDIKHLVVTDGFQWFVFDKKVFYECFASKKKFADSVLTADAEKNTTRYIYEHIIRPHVDTLGSQLRYTYLHLDDVVKVKPEHVARSRKVAAAYKLLSPAHLLKQAVMYDRNELSTAFYHELLYIMGLEEVMVDGMAQIRRCKPEARQRHSLLEETLALFDEALVPMPEEEKEEQALGLVIIWVNRLLFLKLLEGQLLSFNAPESKKFLTPDRIPNYYALSDLFFQILSHPVEERSAELSDRFEDVPYLNSSLFEVSPQETKYFRIKELRMGQMRVYKSTRLHDASRRRFRSEMPTLEYLLRFLDAYDFSGNPLPEAEGEDDEAKTVINAAVLGIIFEQINGYKDGAFFTPSSLSEYMCREVIRRAVVDKFNEAYAQRGKSFADFQTLVDELPVDVASRQEANRLINSIRLCDPSVGSGHFLVSALNELILIKYEIGCLNYADTGNRVKDYTVEIQDDELVVRAVGDGLLRYKREGAGLQMQKTLFEEKRVLIENCLFGVDINPKSVDICRLRLWIELLKNAYYEHGKLQTLPNIDLNIKCGNTLLSKYPVKVGTGILNPDKPALLQEYLSLARDYKECKDKRHKKQMELRLRELTGGEMVLDAAYRSLFDTQVHPSVMASTLDWMLAFPEVLDEDGHFVGFDIVLGNPPYINMQSLPEMSAVYAKLEVRADATGKTLATKGKKDFLPLYKTYASSGDICTLFFERGLHILKPRGYLCFITTNKWLRADFGKDVRRYLTELANPLLLVDFPGQKLFAKATVETCILLLSRDENRQQMQACTTIKRDKGLFDHIHQNLVPCNFHGDEDWVIRTEADKNILQRMFRRSTPLGQWGMTINFGLKTGKNSVFIVSEKKRDEILSLCKDEEERMKTEDIFKPVLKGRDLKRYDICFADRWLIHTHNGIRNPEEDDSYLIEPINIEEYPSLKSYLFGHWNEIKDRTDKGHTPYNLRNCVYWPELDKQKIIWGDLADIPKFCLDENGRFYGDNTTYWMTGSHLTYLLVYLNSPLSAYLFSKLGNTTGAGTIRWQKFKVEQQLVPTVSPADEQRIIDLYEAFKQSRDEAHLRQAYLIIYNTVGLTDEEIEWIENTSNQ